MRALEMLLLLSVVAGVVVHRFTERGTRLHRLAGFTPVIVTLAQLSFEGFRWQLVPAYITAAVLAGRVWSTAMKASGRWPAAAWVTAGVLTVALPTLLPIPRLIEPDGPFAIGTTTVVLTDADRVETYGPEPGGPRMMPLHIWYPSSDSQGEAPGWLETDVASAIAGEYGLPGFFLDHLALTPTRAVPDAPIASGRFPIIMYSHGWTGFGRISPDQPERLASHGYVVVAPDHTYGALVADFPEGLTSYDPAALPDEEDVGTAAYQSASRTLVATYAADLRFVLDQLPALAGFGNHIDLDRVGIFGHSTGGGAAVAACHADERCDAVVGLDPWVEPVVDEVIETGLDQPFLALRSDGWVGEENDERLLRMHGAAAASSTIVALMGSNHYDFVAVSQISPLAGALGFKGPIPGARAQEIIGRTLVAFFDRSLNGANAPLPVFPEFRIDAG